MQQDVKKCKDSLAEAKNRFEIEIKRDDNSKWFGQPVRANMDSILYDHGINKSGAFVGDIDGYKWLWLVSYADSIVGELMVFSLASNSRIDRISYHQIKQVYGTIIFFLWDLDGYLSGMLKKRSHLTGNIAKNKRQYQNEWMDFDQYLQLSTSQKIHMIEDHSCKQQMIFNGIRDVEESFAEKNHQYE